MINFALGRFMMGLGSLQRESKRAAAEAYQHPHEPVPHEMGRQIRGNIESVLKYCYQEAGIEELGNSAIDLDNLTANYEFQPYTWQRLNYTISRFEDDLEREIGNEYFFHYSRDGAKLVARYKTEWAGIIRRFPTAESEIEAGLDSFALTHYTACVFYMMRVVELGMRALAHERQVAFPKMPIEWAQWENVIQQIVVRADDSTKTIGKGPSKDAATTFYADAVAQLRSFKGTRNRVMHMRGNFDDLEATRVIRRAQEFMSGLSTKIGEKTRQPISRWP